MDCYGRLEMGPGTVDKEVGGSWEMGRCAPPTPWSNFHPALCLNHLFTTANQSINVYQDIVSHLVADKIVPPVAK